MLRPQAGIQVDKFYPPTDWLDSNSQQIDIRKNAENNSIVLLVGHSVDFTKYSLLGLLADTSSGTYDVYIDDVLVGSGITKNTQYDIDFSTIATSYGTATTPEALVLHKVVIKPTTSGSTITKFNIVTTTGVTTIQLNGLLWLHLELSNQIDCQRIIGSGDYNVRSQRCVAITSKGNFIDNIASGDGDFRCSLASLLQYVPVLKNIAQYADFYGTSSLKRVVCLIRKISGSFCFNNCQSLEQISAKQIENTGQLASNVFTSNRKIKIVDFKNFSSHYTQLDALLTEAKNLYPTKIDFSNRTKVTKLGMYGSSSYPMRGLRGLKVSNEAPFSSGSPQIDVSYTGLDRDALVELFTSLPAFMPLTVVGSPTITNGVVSGFSSSNYLTLPQISNLANQYEIKAKLKITQNSSSYMAILLSYYNWGKQGIRIKADTLSANLRYIYNETATDKDINLQYNFQENVDYYIKYVYKNNEFYIGVSEDDINYVYSQKETIPSGVTLVQPNNSDVGYLSIGRTYQYSAFQGEIDINNSYTIIDGTKYTFLLPSATTRTLKCVGATGTADLTQADKNIALNKSWALTLS